MALNETQLVKDLGDLVRVVAEAERNRCIEIAEKAAKDWYNGDASTAYGKGYQTACSHIAKAIRATT